FASCGWTPARSTLLNVLKAAAHLIRPLITHLREVVRAGPIIATDDTTVTLKVTDSPLPADRDNPKNVRACPSTANCSLAGAGTTWCPRSCVVTSS
ncbi:MAG: hypothetical protein EBT03_13005, partial [Betaproteobacteria bacterium]|nr:hypothetical protein [Betaproteobacteria bacterium]